MARPEACSPLLTPPLAIEINAATHDLHTRLNALITNRLPLALPPYCDTPALYTAGFRVFADIYIAFEAAWDYVLARPSATPAASALNHCQPPLPIDVLQSCPSQPKQQHTSSIQHTPILQLLAHLQPAGLARTARIHADLQHLHRYTSIPDSSLQHATTRTSSISPRLTPDRAQKSPHLLLAHAWVMYMAVFSGGRWIRRQLRTRGGAEFWGSEARPDPERPAHSDVDTRPSAGAEADADGYSNSGLSFWAFCAGTSDGEQIKAEFKARLWEAEGMLSLAEREEVVYEARALFEDCIGLVLELDRVVGLAGVQGQREIGCETRSENRNEVGDSALTGLGLEAPVVMLRRHEKLPVGLVLHRWWMVIVGCLSLGACVHWIFRGVLWMGFKAAIQS